MKRESVKTIFVALLLGTIPGLLQAQQQKKPQPGTKLTDEQIKEWVAPMRAGRKLTPKSWPNGAKVAVCLSWDMDNETFRSEERRVGKECRSLWSPYDEKK